MRTTAPPSPEITPTVSGLSVTRTIWYRKVDSLYKGSGIAKVARCRRPTGESVYLSVMTSRPPAAATGPAPVASGATRVESVRGPAMKGR